MERFRDSRLDIHTDSKSKSFITPSTLRHEVYTKTSKEHTYSKMN